jgi:hypothetical protein
VKRRNWTPAEDAYLREHYANAFTRDIAAHLGRSMSSVYGRAELLGIKKSEAFLVASVRRFGQTDKNKATRFKPGHEPYNKGKRMNEYLSPEKLAKCKQTCFRPGHIPANARPIGSERITEDGCIEVKVARAKWMYKHRLEWEKHHGAIPAGCNIQFKDGNQANWHIDNLYMIARTEQMKQNGIARYPLELRTAMRLIGKLKRLTRNETDKH